MQRRMTCPTFLHGISKAMPDVSRYAAANGFEGKSDDEIRSKSFPPASPTLKR
jgi:hypothetical protein